MCLSAILGIGSAILGASSANSAANAQKSAANADILFQKQTRDLIRKDLQSYRSAGKSALAGLMYENGLGDMPDGYTGFTATPSYQFRLQQGNDSINALAGARGGLLSGRTLSDLASYNQDMASQEYGNYLTRLGGLADTGLSAASMSGQASQNAAAGVSKALSAIGNAGSAGAIGTGNAIQNGLNLGLGIWQYQNGLKKNTQYGAA